MKLVLDSDAFCKLGAADLLNDTASALVGSLDNCERLPGLPFMLQRGKLPRHLGIEVCNNLTGLARSLPTLGPVNLDWIDLLTAVPAIDPGEVQLLARAADPEVLILSADKRALRALKTIEPVANSLSHRIIMLEAALIFLCRKFGETYVRQRIGPLKSIDKTVRICFSESCGATEALTSYLSALRTELAPLELWHAIT